MKKLTIDRIEEDFAVCECEDLSHIAIPVSCFPFDVKEGMAVIMNNDGSYTRDESEEDEMRKKIIALQNKLRNKTEE